MDANTNPMPDLKRVSAVEDEFYQVMYIEFMCLLA